MGQNPSTGTSFTVSWWGVWRQSASGPYSAQVLVGTLSQGFPLLVAGNTDSDPAVRWCAHSSHAGDHAYTPQTATVKEPEHHGVVRVELGVDRLPMHPPVAGAARLPAS